MAKIFYSDVNLFQPIDADEDTLCFAYWLLNCLGMKIQAGFLDMAMQDVEKVFRNQDVAMKTIQQVMSVLAKTHPMHFSPISLEEWREKRNQNK